MCAPAFCVTANTMRDEPILDCITLRGGKTKVLLGQRLERQLTMRVINKGHHHSIFHFFPWHCQAPLLFQNGAIKRCIVHDDLGSTLQPLLSVPNDVCLFAVITSRVAPCKVQWCGVTPLHSQAAWSRRICRTSLDAVR